MSLSCLFCGGENLKATGRRRSVSFSRYQRFYRCVKCAAFVLYPSLSESEIAAMYTHTYIHEVNPDGAVDQNTNASRFRQLFDFLENRVKNTGDLCYLDFGCGADAETLIFAKSIGYAAQGVELTPSAREEAASRSGCVVLSPNALSSMGNQYDTIFLGDLIEHVYNPRFILTDLKSHLKSDGVIFIQGPLEAATTLSNFLLAIKSLLTPGRSSELPPYHVSLANFYAMKLLLEASGYRIDWYKITEPLWPANRVFSVNSFRSPSNFVFSFTKLLDMAFSKILKNYGTRIYLVAKLK